MNPYDQRPDGAVFNGNDIVRKASPCSRDNDPSYLQPGQTEWFGPMPLEGDEAFWLQRHSEDLAQRARVAARSGIHLQTQTVGAYVRTHRLREGAAKKLSDWKQLPAGVPLLINLDPTAEDIERAMNRVRYMRHHGFGLCRSWTDDAGQLWVQRQ